MKLDEHGSLEWKVGTGATLVVSVLLQIIPTYTRLWCILLCPASFLVLDAFAQWLFTKITAERTIKLVRKGLVLEPTQTKSAGPLVPRVLALALSFAMAFGVWTWIEKAAKDSFPYIVPSVISSSGELKFTLHVGSQAGTSLPASLRYVKAEVTDLDALDRIVAKLGRPPIDEEGWRAIRWIETYDLAPGGNLYTSRRFFHDSKAWEPLLIPARARTRRLKFNATASTGNFSEEIYLTKIGGVWKSTATVWSEGRLIARFEP